MELKKANFDYSLKNIPIPSNDAHLKGLINKTEQFLQRIRWKVFFFLNPSHEPRKETFGFKTKRNAPQSKEIINFENDLTHLIASLEYTEKRTPFQKKLLSDTKKIRNSDKIFVTADKTTNVYQVEKNTYNKMVRDNVTRHYEKTSMDTLDNINATARSITKSLQISDRVEPIAHRDAYITIKDHKENFPNNIKCRLINPAKSNIGKISKMLLQDINEKIRVKHGLQQWRSTSDALNWFKDLKDKTRLKFIQLDIVDFYPSINERLFNTAIDFATETIHLSTQTKEILHNARQSLLFHHDSVWKKKTGLFDVTMGSYDGCELCELVGLLLIHKMRQNFPNINFGLYRDDGLGAHQNMPKCKLEKVKKAIYKLFKELGLSITCETNLIVTNFLDVTFNLHSGKYYPYRKPNDKPCYIHKESNHPPHVAKNIQTAVNKRLCEISCDKESFDSFKNDYEKALKESGHSNKLTYVPPQRTTEDTKDKKKQRKRNVIWFTPPYCASLKTRFGKDFLAILDKNFPVNNPLHKILNRKTVKLGYSCTESIQKIMMGHNKKILSEEKQIEDSNCNCRKKEQCPIPGKCRTQSIVYQATVEHEGKKAEYIGSTEQEFKLRYNNHTHSFRTEKKKAATTLSQYIWSQNLNPSPKIRWRIIKKCKVYSPGKNSCDLCLSEKMHIVRSLKRIENINKRTDIGNKCVHQSKYALGVT